MPQMEELLLGSSQSSQNVSVCAWNSTTGNLTTIYKNGGPVATKSMCQLGDEYVLTAEVEKPLLHLWSLNSQEQVKNVRLVLPEPAKALDVDPTNNYLAIGINLKLYVWHLNSGKLLSILQKNFQPVTCVKFSNTGEYLVVAGQDGMVVTYKFNDVVSFQSTYLTQKDIGQCEPLYTRLDSVSVITDICLGNFGSKSRLATVSADLSCRIYDLHNGTPVLILTYHRPLSAVIFDLTCWNLFVGNVDGSIQQVCLKDPPRTLEHHVNHSMNFIEHKQKITCLDINMSNTYLASGSQDCMIIIWEIKSRSALHRINQNGPITNIKFVLNHENFHVQAIKHKVVFKSLQRNLDNDADSFTCTFIQDCDVSFDDEKELSVKNDSSTLKLETELNNVKIINTQLYNSIVEISKKYNNVK